MIAKAKANFRKGGMALGCRIVTRSGLGRHSVLVFDRRNELHFPLTIFAREAMNRCSSGTARLYLNVLIPFFDWLEINESEGRIHRIWGDTPEVLRREVDNYLVERLKCKVKEHRAGFQLLALTDGTRSTVRVFLSALKLFYRIMRAQDRYRHTNPLVDGPSAVLAEIELQIDDDVPVPRMLTVSGVILPRKQRLSDSYFKLVGESWTPQVIDDAEFPARILGGGRKVGWRLQGECITRILFESGCRVSEVVGLTLGDWAARGLLQEAQAFSKGSHGRRVKFIRFSAATAKLLRRCFDTERRQLDQNHYPLDEYIRRAQAHGTDLDHVPLFLSRRRTQLTPKAFRESCWDPACRVAAIEADVHQTRHWYVTQVMRGIYETSRVQPEMNRRLRELIEYMGWRSGWQTLEAYQHYFDPQRHAEMQDRLHQRLDAALKNNRVCLPEGHSALSVPSSVDSQAEKAQSSHESDCDSDLEYLLALGGKRAARRE